MSHPDDETLALLALGEDGGTAAEQAHVASCDRCRHTLDGYRAVVGVGRRVEPADLPIAPRAEVWQRVLAEVRHEHGDEQAEPVEPAAPAVVVPLDGRRAPAPARLRRLAPVAAAAAVGLLVGAGATWGLTRDSSPAPSASPPTKITVAALRPLDDPTASGRAVLRVQSPASRTVTITVTGLPRPSGAFYEVWLMDPSNAHLVALGVLDSSGRGVYSVPSGLDLGRYSAVDVSLQPMNGSPLHSANSAVRGSIDG